MGLAAVEESWTFPSWEGKPARVEVYSNADEVELWLNGERLGRRPVCDYKAEFFIAYRPGVLRTVNVRNGRPAEETTLETAGESVALALTVEQPALPAGGDIVYLWAEVQDGAGVCLGRSTRSPVQLLGQLKSLLLVLLIQRVGSVFLVCLATLTVAGYCSFSKAKLIQQE